MTTLPRVVVVFFALLVGALFSTSAEAASKRVGVPKFDGAQEALVRKKVMQIIKAHGFDLAKSREMEIGLANSGALLDNDEGFAKVAKELALSAIVTGEVGKKRAKISVHDGRDGSLLGEASFAGANPRKMMAEVGRDFWRKLGDAVARGKTPSGAKKPQKVVAEAPEDNENTPDAAGGEGEAAPEPTKSKSTKEAVAEESGGGSGEGDEGAKKKKKKKKLKMDGTAGDAGPQEEAPEVVPPAFDIQAGVRAISRTLGYHQDASMPGLRTYSIFPAPAVFSQIVLYPIGFFTDGFAKDIGFEASAEQAFGVSSSLPAMNGMPAQKFGTTIHEFGGGLRYRIPWGPGHYFYASVTGGEHAFTFSSTSTGDRHVLDIPDTIYRYARPGIGLHFEAVPGVFSLTLSAGYRYIFNKGGQFHDQFFTHATVNGVDAQLTLAYRFNSWFEVRAMGDIRRYFSSMNCFGGTDAGGNAINQCSPQFTAGGAIDQYISGTGMVAFTWGGSETKTAEEAEAPPPPPKRKRKASEEEEPPLGNDVKSGGGGEEE
jgi:hypothetical protein